MGFRTGAYAKVWAVAKDQSGHVTAEMSTSKKNKDTGKYENDWSNKYVRLFGEAAKASEKLERGATVRIGDCDVTNYFSKEKNTLYTNYTIFTFMEDTNDQKRSAKDSKSAYMEVPKGVEEELPFN